MLLFVIGEIFLCLGFSFSIIEKLLKIIELTGFVCFTVSNFSPQTEDIVVEEPRGRNHYVPFTLTREKGTYGTVNVNFEVRGQ